MQTLKVTNIGKYVAVSTLLLFAAPLGARNVALVSSIPHRATVGEIITWRANVSDGPPSNLWYRFRVRYAGTQSGVCAKTRRVPIHSRCVSTDFTMVRDFGPDNSIDWAASEHEGNYEIELSTRDNDTGEVSVATSIFHVSPRVTGDTPVLSDTESPLVFRYSAPPCPSGSQMRVQFTGPDGSVQSTPTKPCDGALTMNFYLAGMRAETAYNIQQIVENGAQVSAGPVLTRSTAALDQSFGPYSVAQAPAEQSSQPVLLQSRGGWPVATDLAGNVIWYFTAVISYMSRPEPGGYFLGWYEDQSVGPEGQYLREFDLAGNTIRETNAARVSEQLVAMGMHPINAFHHEVRALPDGSILALAASERILTDVQGPGAVDVLGDTIVVLDANLQLLWAWDTFDHLDTHRAALLGETCRQAANGCAPIYLAPFANDWTHGNSLQLTPDGNILYSSRHQDWIIKIDYRNGEGSGDILWRLGKDGDFQFLSADPNPWFSHQHDASIGDDGLVTLFDNNDGQYVLDQSAHSRGQVIRIDEDSHTASFVLNADLGRFSIALGSAQKLANGNYHFHLGYLPDTSTAQIVEVDPSGKMVYRLDVGELEYRSFRMTDLYTP